jgi:Tol biopolymer transport system component
MPANGWSFASGITPDGRYIAFVSTATNLISSDTNGVADSFAYDRWNGTTELVSVGSGGVQGDNESYAPLMSADGRYAAFISLADNLVPGDTNGALDVFVRDRQAGTTQRVSVSSSGAQANGTFGFNVSVAISADGRYVVFSHGAWNLVPGDTNGIPDIFVHDLYNGTTERVSVDSGGLQANGESWSAWLSGEGRYVAFLSGASNLVSGDTNGSWDVFVRDRRLHTTERVNIGSVGLQADGLPARYLNVSSDGRFVVFDSGATNLVPGGTGGWSQVYLRDRAGGTSFTSTCNPGSQGVIICPCSNPASSLERGCNNSSNTGGGSLSASGGTFLSSDSLWFTTADERPSALSILTQWGGTGPTGVVFGMGVRCTSGTFKRLYTRTAVGGSITAPDFGAGDLQVSIRSAALGDTILPGDSRYYLVYYRDPHVLGSRPASSTFNCTQTGQVTWSP